MEDIIKMTDIKDIKNKIVDLKLQREQLDAKINELLIAILLAENPNIRLGTVVKATNGRVTLISNIKCMYNDAYFIGTQIKKDGTLSKQVYTVYDPDKCEILANDIMEYSQKYINKVEER